MPTGSLSPKKRWTPSLKKKAPELSVQDVERLKRRIRQASYMPGGGQDWVRFFRSYNRHTRVCGEMTWDEFNVLVRRNTSGRMHDVEDGVLRQLFDEIDTDKSGKVDMDEFVAWLKSAKKFVAPP